VRTLALAVVVVAVASPAAVARAESERTGSFSFRGQTFLPNIDSEFGGTHTPYATMFGNRTRWMFRVEGTRAVYDKLGTLELGASVGYFSASGHGIVASSSSTTPVLSVDKTGFNVVPTSVFVHYRFDWLADRYNIPLAPYARASLERYNWWVTGSGGNTTRAGATNGWGVAGGLAILLDFFDPGLAREMDRDTGIRHTYLFVDVSKAWVYDFGWARSWDLSDKKPSIGVGLTFVF
jgi:hypothetical protein